MSGRKNRGKGGKQVKPSNTKPTPGQYAKSDKAAAKSGGKNAVGKGVLPCQKKGPIKPCDLTELTLTEIKGSLETTYRLVKGKLTADAPEASDRAISLFGTQPAAPKEPILQVVGDRPGAKAATKITVDVKPFATCGARHVEVTVFPPPGESEIDHISRGADSFNFVASRYQSASLVGSLFQRYITWGLAPSAYLVNATSCGVRQKGKSNTGGVSTVEVFPADQYELALSVPALGKVAFEREKTRDAEGTTQSDSLTVGLGMDSIKGSRSISTDEKGVSLIKDEIEEVPQELSLTLTRNGTSEDVSADLTELFKILTSVEEAIKAIKDVIQEWVPQVGFKFEFELSFLAGTIKMVWGYKEHTDWRVYYGWSAQFSLTFFEISLTLSFGIKLPLALARVEGTCSGSTELETDFDFNSPDTPIEPSVKVTVDIPAQLDGRAEAGYGWCSVALEIGVKTGFDGEVGVRTKETSIELYAEIKWCGLDAYVNHQDRPGVGEEEEVWHLIDEKELWEGALDF